MANSVQEEYRVAERCLHKKGGCSEKKDSTGGGVLRTGARFFGREKNSEKARAAEEESM